MKRRGRLFRRLSLGIFCLIRMIYRGRRYKNPPCDHGGMDLSIHSSKGNESIMETLANDNVADMLRSNGIPLTLQRLAIAKILFAQPIHITAERVLSQVQKIMPEISRATVYNTLNLFKERKLLRELVIAPGRVVYDSNTSHHYHIYDVDTGEMTDIPAGELTVVGSTSLPVGVELEEIDVIIRVHSKTH